MTEEDEEFNRIEREASLRKAAVAATVEKREWVGLSDDEVAQLMFKCDVIVTGPTQFNFAKAIETKLKEKNEM
jgi:hypothetical protein